MNGALLVLSLLLIFGGLRKIAAEEWESWGRLDHGQRQLVWGGLSLGFGLGLLLLAGSLGSLGPGPGPG